MFYATSSIIMTFYWKVYLIWFYFIMLFIYLCIILHEAEVLAESTLQLCRGTTKAALGCLWSVSLLPAIKPFVPLC